MPPSPARTVPDDAAGARQAAADLQALAVALEELAGAMAAAPAHARIPGAEGLLARCLRLVAGIGAGQPDPGLGGPAASPQDAMAQLSTRAPGAGPEWHDWFLTADVRRVRRRR